MKLKNLLFNFVIASLLVFAVQSAFEIEADPFVIATEIVAGVALFSATVIVLFGHKIDRNESHGTRLTYMAIQKEIWSNWIVENLFKANEFLNYCMRVDDYVLQGKVVHLPAAGSKATVVKNRSSLPATVTNRTDTDITYSLDEFTTDPLTIPNAETIELSYDKMSQAMGEHQDGLSENVADDILVRWCKSTGGSTTTATIILTTGGAVLSHMPSATGNRKKFLKEDLLSAQAKMNKANIPKADRYALISTEMMAQLMSDADLVKRDFGKELNLPEGSIGKLYGFWLIDRSYTVTYDATPAVKAVGAAAAATDNDAVICWQKNQVECALGDVKFFEQKDAPTMYGDVFSALVRAGGRIRRAAGVVVIVQDAAA